MVEKIKLQDGSNLLKIGNRVALETKLQFFVFNTRDGGQVSLSRYRTFMRQINNGKIKTMSDLISLSSGRANIDESCKEYFYNNAMRALEKKNNV